MNLIKNQLLSITFLLVLIGCSNPKKRDSLTIAAAANTQYAIKALIEDFERKTGISCELITGSSGKITAQIIEGAPYDIFIAADMNYPEAVYRAGKALKAPESYGYGQLVLWTVRDGVVPSAAMLEDTAIAHIAIANPNTAPYGKAAMEVLEHYGLSEVLEDKLVYGESIAQTNQFITSEAATVGFTAMAVVLSKPLKNIGRWKKIDTTAYSPLRQGAIIVDNDFDNLEKRKRFYAYLFSDEAKILLKNFGYLNDE